MYYNNIMEIFSLEDLYNLAIDLVNKIELKTYNTKDLIIFIRKNQSKKLLNSFCIAGKLDKFEMNILKSDISNVKLSLDNIIKNIINHPDLNLYDYKRINKIISYPDEVICSKNKNNCICEKNKIGYITNQK